MPSPAKKRGRGRPRKIFKGFAAKEKAVRSLKREYDSDDEYPIGSPVHTSTPTLAQHLRGRAGPSRDESSPATKSRISNIILGNRAENVGKGGLPGLNSAAESDPGVLPLSDGKFGDDVELVAQLTPEGSARVRVRPPKKETKTSDITHDSQDESTHKGSLPGPTSLPGSDPDTLLSEFDELESAVESFRSALEGSARVRGRLPKKQSPSKIETNASDITHDNHVETTGKGDSAGLNLSPASRQDTVTSSKENGVETSLATSNVTPRGRGHSRSRTNSPAMKQTSDVTRDIQLKSPTEGGRPSLNSSPNPLQNVSSRSGDENVETSAPASLLSQEASSRGRGRPRRDERSSPKKANTSDIRNDVKARRRETGRSSLSEAPQVMKNAKMNFGVQFGMKRPFRRVCWNNYIEAGQCAPSPGTAPNESIRRPGRPPKHENTLEEMQGASDIPQGNQIKKKGRGRPKKIKADEGNAQDPDDDPDDSDDDDPDDSDDDPDDSDDDQDDEPPAKAPKKAGKDAPRGRGRPKKNLGESKAGPGGSSTRKGQKATKISQKGNKAARHSTIPNLKIDFTERNGRWNIILSGTGPILHPDVKSNTCKHCNTHYSSLKLTSK